MNIFYSRLLLLNLLTPCIGSPFLNLDFQSPNIRAILNPQSGGLVRVHDALPGWQLQSGSESVQLMYYNKFCLSCPSASLSGPQNPTLGSLFTFGMNSVFNSPNLTILAETIYQTGEVPTNTKSLQFVAGTFPNIESLHVSLGGQQLLLAEFKAIDFIKHLSTPHRD